MEACVRDMTEACCWTLRLARLDAAIRDAGRSESRGALSTAAALTLALSAT